MPLLQGGQGARADLSRRAVPDAGLDDRRQLAQQHRLHAGRLDRAAPDLREARRRRPVPHSLRSVARHPDGAGHALDLPVPEGRRLQLPDRRLPRQGPGHRRQGRRRLGLRRPDDGARRLDGRQAVRRIRPISSTPGRSRSCSPSTSCPARRATIRSPTCRTARSTGSIISSRRASCCSSTSPTRTWSSSTSIRKARIQDRERLKPILQGSIAFVRHIDEAAACMYALQHEVLAAQDIPVQGIGREAYRSSRCRGCAGCGWCLGF